MRQEQKGTMTPQPGLPLSGLQLPGRGGGGLDNGRWVRFIDSLLGALYVKFRSLSHPNLSVSSKFHDDNSLSIFSAEKMGSKQARRHRMASSSSVSDL